LVSVEAAQPAEIAFLRIENEDINLVMGDADLSLFQQLLSLRLRASRS
jgi:hypothetical protein